MQKHSFSQWTNTENLAFYTDIDQFYDFLSFFF